VLRVLSLFLSLCAAFTQHLCQTDLHNISLSRVFTGNVEQLSRFYGFAKDGPTGVKLAMEAGLDQNMGGQYVT
jgi:hypothetical protein